MLRWLSRGIILERKLPLEFGGHSILVSPESALSYWRKDLSKVDPFLLSMARELVKPGMEVWDIGANVGLFSFAAAGLGAQVLAVEADRWLVNLMQRSTQLNGLPLRVIEAAVLDSCGTSELHFSKNGRASNSLLGDGPGKTVRTITLDSLLDTFPAPDVLKIDIEGVEVAALKGACRVLQCHPAIFCEVSQHPEELGALLTAAGYTLYAARAQQRKPLQKPSRDTLALPAAS
jgi:FkbM family methyltransferase